MPKKYPMNIKVRVKQSHIDKAACREPLACMHRLAIDEAFEDLGCPASRIAVDSSGISVTRKGNTHREHARLPKPAGRTMLAFDRKEIVKPHSYTIRLVRTTKIEERSEEAKAKNLAAVNKNRAKRIKEGIPEPKRKVRSLGLSA